MVALGRYDFLHPAPVTLFEPIVNVYRKSPIELPVIVEETHTGQPAGEPAFVTMQINAIRYVLSREEGLFGSNPQTGGLVPGCDVGKERHPIDGFAFENREESFALGHSR
jgi:hypothetical protein